MSKRSKQQLFSELFSDHKKTKNDDITVPKIKYKDIINKEELQYFLDELKCPICIHVIENPSKYYFNLKYDNQRLFYKGTCVKCETNFCLDCISKWNDQNHGYQCPCCSYQAQKNINLISQNVYVQFQQNDFSEKYTSCSKIFQKLLNQIEFKCHNEECQSILKYEERQSHLKTSCQYKRYNCPYADNGCSETFKKISESDHLNNCQYKQEQCKYCKNDILIKQLQNHKISCYQTYIQSHRCSIQCNQFKHHQKYACYESQQLNLVKGLQLKNKNSSEIIEDLQQ